jgi:uncharacterized protein (DUF362 family)
MLDRRSFIRSLLQAGTLTALGGIPGLDLRLLPAVAAEGPQLALRKEANIPLLTRQTVAALGGMERFVKPGDVVVVKPNIGWDRTPELAANTHPEVVLEVVRLCLEAGVKQVRIFDRTCNDPRRCYRQSGIEEGLEALKDPRVSLEHMDRRAYREIDIAGGEELQRWSFYQPALDADRLINLPVAKHHSISRLTVGMKNIMGVIGGNRGVLHRNIAEALVDINLVVHSDLTIVDATRILVANGPQGGRPEDVEVRNTLIASADIVAADAMAATLFDLRPDEIGSIVAGARRGLGVMDLKRVQMV